MPDSSPPAPQPPPSRIDRASLERVLTRASELQASTGDAPDQFTEDQLLELGREVGLSAQHLRQALAEERTRSIVPDDEPGLEARLFGPSRVRAARIVPGKVADVLDAIDDWMQREELLTVKRHHADRIVWEPRRGIVVGIKRTLAVGGRDYVLLQAFEASATVIQVDETRVQVAVDADFRTNRRFSRAQLIGLTTLGAVVSGSLFVIGALAAVAIVPAIIGPVAGFAGARATLRHTVTRAQLALEQLLDRLERGEFRKRGADSLLGAIVAAATALPPKR